MLVFLSENKILRLACKLKKYSLELFFVTFYGLHQFFLACGPRVISEELGERTGSIC